MAAVPPFYPVSGGVRICVRLTPKARRNLVDGVIQGADGTCVLKVRVTAPPEKGQANAALIDLLASEWGIAKSQMRILTGTRNRNKIVLITGNPEALLAQLSERGG